MRARRIGTGGGVVAALFLGGCQLISGLDGLSLELSGESSVAAAAGTGGGAPSSSSGSGGASSGTGGAGGSCTGICVVVPDTSVTVDVLAINTTHIFWGHTGPDVGMGSIHGAGLSGEKTVIPLQSSVSPVSLAAGASKIFWTEITQEGSEVTVADVGPPGPKPTVIESNQGIDTSRSIVIHEDYVYWAVPSYGKIRRTAVMNPGGIEDVATMEVPFGERAVLAFNGATNPATVLWPGTNKVYGKAVEGMPPSVTVAGIEAGADAGGMAVNGTHVYWAERALGNVMRANKSLNDQKPELVADTQPYPSHVIADDAYVYWAVQGEGACTGEPFAEVRRRATLMSGGDVETLIKNIPCPSNFVQDATHVYVGAGMTIYRISK